MLQSIDICAGGLSASINEKRCVVVTLEARSLAIVTVGANIKRGEQELKSRCWAIIARITGYYYKQLVLLTVGR